MNNQGIATLTILLIIAGVIVIGGGTWYLTQEPEPEPVVTEEEEPEIADNITADWQTYRNEEAGLEFRHPSNWAVEESVYTTPGGGKHVSFYIKGLEEDEVISINIRQASCGDPAFNFVKCEMVSEIPIFTNSQKIEVHEVFDQILSTFKFLDPLPSGLGMEELIVLESGQVGEYYSASLPFDAGKNPDGISTLQPSRIKGELPPGISMEMPVVDQTTDFPPSEAALREQRISGTPTQEGKYAFTIRYSEAPYYEEIYEITIESAKPETGLPIKKPSFVYPHIGAGCSMGAEKVIVLKTNKDATEGISLLINKDNLDFSEIPQTFNIAQINNIIAGVFLGTHIYSSNPSRFCSDVLLPDPPESITWKAKEGEVIISVDYSEPDERIPGWAPPQAYHITVILKNILFVKDDNSAFLDELVFKDIRIGEATVAVTRSKAIEINPRELLEKKAEGDSIDIELFDDEVHKCIIQKITYYDFTDRTAVRCRAEKHDATILIFDLDKNQMTGTINFYNPDKENYRITPYLDKIDKHFLEEIKTIW